MKPLPVEMPPGGGGDRFNIPIRRRKFSIPAVLHMTGENVASTARRRLSNVSETVSRKLSHTLGWQTPTIPIKLIVNSGKCFFGQYILYRLKRAGLFSRKMGAQRVRFLIGDINVGAVQETFPVIAFVSDEMERSNSKVYANIGRQLCRSSSGTFQGPDDVKFIMIAAARELFQAGDITWSKVIAMYVVIGGYAVDCVKNGYLDYFADIIETVGTIIETYLVGWIHEKGGWASIYSYYATKPPNTPSIERFALSLGAFVIVMMIYSLINYIS